MLFNKKLHNADKKIGERKNIVIDSEGDAVISLKATSKEQIFSAYDYDKYEKLNGEICDYIWDKAKFVPVKNEIKIKLYTTKDIEEEEFKIAFQSKYQQECLEVKQERKRNAWFCVIMFIMGILTLTFLLLSYTFFQNQYLDTLLEIMTWVFIWEAADGFFLTRMGLKGKYRTLLKLYNAKIKVIKINNLEKKLKKE